jgi:hypothetical protein
MLLVALRGGEAAHAEAVEDLPHRGVPDLEIVISGEVHRDLQRPEVIVLAQVDDLADHVPRRLVGAVLRP